MSNRGNKKRIVVEGGRKLTRLQAKLLNDLPREDSSVATPVPGKKVSAWAPRSRPALAKSNDKMLFEQHVSSLPVKRMKEAGNVSKPRPERPSYEHGELEDDSSSNAQAIINNILGLLDTAIPADRDI